MIIMMNQPTTMFLRLLVSSLYLSSTTVVSYSLPLSSTSASSSSSTPSSSSSRRAVLQQVLTSLTVAAAATTATVATSPVLAADEPEPEESVYFGVGCFWHIQHEFVQAEKDLLNRNERTYTSATGYAGGKATDSQGRVCYHNMQGVADYGKLGHGEVVNMKLPINRIADFCSVYFSLYDPRTKDRVDPLDRGGEYRSLIGLPGGTQHPVYPKMEAIAQEAGFTLKAGKGNDPDTLKKQIVYVYDTAEFPFYQAEVYHQFHNDFQSPAYGKAYNNLANVALEDGRIHITGCPDRV